MRDEPRLFPTSSTAWRSSTGMKPKPMTKPLKKKAQMVVALREGRDKASEADETHPAQGPQIGVAGGELEEGEREEENVKKRKRKKRRVHGWWGRKRKINK